MEHIAFLIKPASSLCNMKCEYCFYRDSSELRKISSYGVMQNDVMEKLVDFSFQEISDEGSISYAFQGGEPTLAGLAYFEAFTAYVAKKRSKQTIQYAIQSNGLLLDETWVTFFKKHDFLVGISLDGFQENHDFFRKDEKRGGTFQRVMHAISLLKKAQVAFNVLCVLSEQLAHYPQELYTFFKSQGFTYIQLIPCLDNKKKHNRGALSAKMFYTFYTTYFTLWLEDYKQGKAQHINLFDNILLMVNDKPPYQCGMLGFCAMQFVIEADGSIFPCDFYVEDALCLGNVLQDTPATILANKTLKAFLQERKTKPMCSECRYANLCHGGCKRMNTAFLTEEYCGYQKLLEDILD